MYFGTKGRNFSFKMKIIDHIDGPGYKTNTWVSARNSNWKSLESQSYKHNLEQNNKGPGVWCD